MINKTHTGERWTAFKETILIITENICGKIKFNKHLKRTKWWNNEIKNKVNEKQRGKYILKENNSRIKMSITGREILRKKA